MDHRHPAVAKIVATSLSIGRGGSGGLFGPGIVIGAFVGAADWRVGEPSHLPGIPHDPGIFVVVGMMACFGSVARAPLAIMIMVAEMTGSFSVVPAIIAVGIAALLMSRTNVTIYEAQRLDRRRRGRARASGPTRRPNSRCRLFGFSPRGTSALFSVSCPPWLNLPAALSEVRPDKPLKLLQRPRLSDQEVLSHRVEFVGLVDGPAEVLDTPL